MEDGTKYVLDKLDSYANSLTGFIVVQGLAFCYALGNPRIIDAFRTNGAVRWATGGSMIIALIVVVLVLYRLRQQAASIVGEDSCMRPILWVYWVRIGAVALYGILPLLLLLALCGDDASGVCQG